MNKQYLLFESMAARWAQTVLGRLHSDVRREVVLILAEMGRAAVGEKNKRLEQETDDESGTDHPSS